MLASVRDLGSAVDPTSGYRGGCCHGVNIAIALRITLVEGEKSIGFSRIFCYLVTYSVYGVLCRGGFRHGGFQCRSWLPVSWLVVDLSLSCSFGQVGVGRGDVVQWYLLSGPMTLVVQHYS